MFVEQILRFIIRLLVVIWGPIQFGLFSYAIAFAAIFSSIAKMGITEDVMSANRILNT
jgi:O-antigen/teichoic acid export membrane protein